MLDFANDTFETLLQIFILLLGCLYNPKDDTLIPCIWHSTQIAVGYSIFVYVLDI